MKNRGSNERLITVDTKHHSKIGHGGSGQRRTVLGTNLSSAWSNLDQSNLASPLGNAAIVETTDADRIAQEEWECGRMSAHRRNARWTSRAREMVGIRTMADWNDKLNNNSGDEDADWSEDIAKELFDSMIREVVEETGIPQNNLGNVLCIGFTRRVLNHRPDIIFYIPCNISSDEVKAMYAAGPEHKSESTELILLHWNDFANRVIEEDAINMPG